MDDVVIARHGESEASARGIVGGDSPLTDRGREQARELGERLAGQPLDLCLTSPRLRARRTAEIALAGRDLPHEVVPELADIDFGDFEGSSLEEYREWVRSHPPTEPAPGGESRVATLRRYAEAFRGLLAASERHVLVVAHGLTVRALLDERPRPVVANAPYADEFVLTRLELGQAVERLERWCESPSW
jgi:broad specificity phosphatase PhoE